MAIEIASVNWPSARRATYQVTQSFRYEYPEPIRDLSHRLVVIPPERFGDQRRLRHDVSVGLEGVKLEDSRDRFGNVIVDVFAPRVASAIEFDVNVSVERRAAQPNRVLDGWLADGYLLQPSPLTTPDDRIAQVAEELGNSAHWGLELAERITDWVNRSMTYRYGVTGVRTTAAEALAQGAGVCQDYAHVMLAITRACGLPSRYVSGHLLGQGGTHAWVEVILPANDGTGEGIAYPFDPTQATKAGLSYVTIAIGGDYADVAPTSGTYRSQLPGRLMTRKSVTLMDLE
jgi:transglutaminase-like putative cysteine protease